MGTISKEQLEFEMKKKLYEHSKNEILHINLAIYVQDLCDEKYQILMKGIRELNK